MKRKTLGFVVAIIIALLFFHEATAWARFDWKSFGKASRNIRIAPALVAAVLIYIGYFLRALRWKILMRPLKNTRILPLLRSTIIGFAALAVLGRPAEFVRPYLIAREEALGMSSQLAIWTLERIFDVGAAGLLVLAGVLASPELRTLPYMGQFGRIAWLAGWLALIAAVAGLLIWRFRSRLWSGRRQVAGTSFASGLFRGTSAFSEGVKGLRGPAAFTSVAALSLSMWLAIAMAYFEVVRACPFPLAVMSFPAVLLLMGFSLAGSLVQLPGGGAAQLIVIAVLSNVFAAPVELSLACGILLWLATYMIPIPVGLLLLRKQHFSLKTIARASAEVNARQSVSEAPG
ncbi:MAG TPA: lysylphosphatidylglycerol synthase transmembrane domain-containing protein [Terriglobales bacterium]|nr:lysylphosphatidylglycerol synthase transmembrane domain-containing protein [Terriglobales bacterium]